MNTIPIYPTGKPDNTDVQTVKAAIAGAQSGDVILLKATTDTGVPCVWHFGDDTSIHGRDAINVMTNGVIAIVGELCTTPPPLPNNETPAIPLDRTVIYGGIAPITCRYDNPGATKLIVQNIYFAYPSRAAVQVTKSAGLEVSDCIVYDVVSGLPMLEVQDILPQNVALGIEATGLVASHLHRAIELTGEFKVLRNKVKRSADDPATYDRADAGIVLQFSKMRGYVIENEVTGFGLAGIAIVKSDDAHVVMFNTVEDCGYGSTAMPEAAGIGIQLSAAPPDMSFITNNTIKCGSVKCPNGPLHPKNGITVAGAFGAVMEDNKLTGTVSAHGIAVTAKSGTESKWWEIAESNQLAGLGQFVDGPSSPYPHP